MFICLLQAGQDGRLVKVAAAGCRTATDHYLGVIGQALDESAHALELVDVVYGTKQDVAAVGRAGLRRGENLSLQ